MKLMIVHVFLKSFPLRRLDPPLEPPTRKVLQLNLSRTVIRKMALAAQSPPATATQTIKTCFWTFLPSDFPSQQLQPVVQLIQRESQDSETHAHPMSLSEQLSLKGDSPEQALHHSRLVAGAALMAAKKSLHLACDRPTCLGVGATCTDLNSLTLSLWSDFIATSVQLPLPLNLTASILESSLRAAISGQVPGQLAGSTSAFRQNLIYPLKKGTIRYGMVDKFGNVTTALATASRKLILSGSFNPLHVGHVNMLMKTSAYLARSGQVFDDVAFELSAFNADKPPLSDEPLLDRLTQFAGRWSVIVTNAPIFVMKAALILVASQDTAVRLLMNKYYGNSDEEMAKVFEEFAALNSHFVVAGRVSGDGKFLTLEDIEFPQNFAFKSLFSSLPQDVFREDVSSTAIRNRQADAGV